MATTTNQFSLFLPRLASRQPLLLRATYSLSRSERYSRYQTRTEKRRISNIQNTPPSTATATASSRASYTTSSPTEPLLFAALEPPPQSSSSPSQSTLQPEKQPSLSLLPWPLLLRTILIQYASQTPLLLTPSLYILNKLAHSTSPLFNPDRNPVLNFILRKTLYAQFCAGSNEAQVASTVSSLQKWGVQGIVLGWAREVDDSSSSSVSEEQSRELMKAWARGSEASIALSRKDDIVALKLSGAGAYILNKLHTSDDPPPFFDGLLRGIFDKASSKGVKVVFDAEHAHLQPGIEAWTTFYARIYNIDSPIVYGTYQSYLKRTPSNLKNDIEVSNREGWKLGVKLVRGAYLASDPRDLFWDSKDDTDTVYDLCARSIVTRDLAPLNQAIALARPTQTVSHEQKDERMQDVSLVLATHNMHSVRSVLSIREAQLAKGERLTDLTYAQLMGMADHVSCEAIAARTNAATNVVSSMGEVRSLSTTSSVAPPSKDDSERSMTTTLPTDNAKVYKYLVWGTVGECMRYLVRRGEENRDGMKRTREGTRALVLEVRRRLGL